jgi:hypothetical protein
MRNAIVLSVLAVASAQVAIAADPPAKSKPRPANRLAKENSPYLRQHAHNPVDWYPWGSEAFAKAKKEDKLVFLSIGYSSCHWCHVMERESFDNDAVAKILNENFVCIKVDREERPDIDHVYMTALQVGFRQRGGWPMSMFLTADAKPIIGGTYWPPDDRMVEGEKMLGFKSVLQIILDVRKTQPRQMLEQADTVAEQTAKALRQTGAADPLAKLDKALVQATIDAVAEEFDPEFGGFGNKSRNFRGTKFPTPVYLELLLTQSADAKAEASKKMLAVTLDRMARGGIYDQLGGGFHRYSTERSWTVPHFEKMLYDNAQLVEVYSRAYAFDPNPLYQKAVRETLTFVAREMTSPEGGFYSALDADSEGVEGKFYVWTPGAIDAVLSDPAERELARAIYGADRDPNFEHGATILTLPSTLTDAATARKIPVDQLQARLVPIREKLLAAREKRPRPFLDTKVLTAWNGQMIAGYAAAGRAFQDPTYLATARHAADFILTKMRTKDGRLLRSYMTDTGAKLPGYLDDYAFLTHGLLVLHEVTNEKRWLDEAKALTDTMIRWHHDDKDGGFFYTSNDHEKLFARSKDQYDGAQPSGNSMATRNLIRLSTRTGDARYRDLAEQTLRTFAGNLRINPTGLTLMATALHEFLAVQVVAKAAPGQLGNPGAAKRVDSSSVVKSTITAAAPDAGGKQVVTIAMDIDKPWHLYANPVGFEDLDSAKTTVKISGADGLKVLSIDYPKGVKLTEKLADQTIEYQAYEGKVEIKATVQRAAGDTSPIKVSVKFMACKAGTCLKGATVEKEVK